VKILRMQDLPLADKRVLIRVDFNVPIHHGQITSDTRIRAALPTIHLALEAGAQVTLMSHLGRPKEGQFEAESSLAPVAECLSKLLKRPVRLEQDWLRPQKRTAADVVLCENVRFQIGENANDDALAKKMAALCDIFVMDAFATAHRAQASTYGVAKFAPVACMGLLVQAELDALTRALMKPKRPVVAIVGGSKVSSKLLVLRSLIHQVDQLIVGGGIVNTFLAAAGFSVGKSLYEPDLLEEARQMLDLLDAKDAMLPLPTDVVVAKSFSETAEATVKSVSTLASDDMILDIGPETIHVFEGLLKKAGTIVWNGPVGVLSKALVR